MTASKPRKAAPRKRVDPAIRELRRAVRGLIGITDCQRARIEALETRGHFRDASHDEPVSNANEAIGVPLTPSQLARLIAYEGKRWWQFWRSL